MEKIIRSILAVLVLAAVMGGVVGFAEASSCTAQQENQEKENTKEREKDNPETQNNGVGNMGPANVVQNPPMVVLLRTNINITGSIVFLENN